jgi:flagellar biosynthesis/type III secretory pathway protein FliH
LIHTQFAQARDELTMATIIRKDYPRQMSSGRIVQPVAFSMTDLRVQADEYLTMVRQEAAKIVQTAQGEAEQIRRQAEVAGRKAAEAAVERILDEKVARRMETLLPALEQLVAQVNDARGELLKHWEQSALRVATTIAERIIRRQLDRQPQITLDLIEEALRLAAGSAELKLHMNPQDYEHLGPQVERLAVSLGRLTPSEVVADPAIAPGGCRVETKFGEIDMQIASQLRRIEEELE